MANPDPTNPPKNPDELIRAGRESYAQMKKLRTSAAVQRSEELTMRTEIIGPLRAIACFTLEPRKNEDADSPTHVRRFVRKWLPLWRKAADALRKHLSLTSVASVVSPTSPGREIAQGYFEKVLRGTKTEELVESLCHDIVALDHSSVAGDAFGIFDCFQELADELDQRLAVERSSGSVRASLLPRTRRGALAPPTDSPQAGHPSEGKDSDAVKSPRIPSPESPTRHSGPSSAASVPQSQAASAAPAPPSRHVSNDGVAPEPTEFEKLTPRQQRITFALFIAGRDSRRLTGPDIVRWITNALEESTSYETIKNALSQLRKRKGKAVLLSGSRGLGYRLTRTIRGMPTTIQEYKKRCRPVESRRLTSEVPPGRRSADAKQKGAKLRST